MIASGILAYVFFATVTRSLPATEAAPVYVLWTYWSIAGAVFTFPLQHWIVQRITTDPGSLGAALRRVWSLVLVSAVVVGLASWLLRQPLFRRGDVVFPVFVGLVTAGSVYLGVVRGLLVTRGRTGAVSMAILGENAIRAGGGLVIAAVGGDAATFGIAMVVGPLVGLAWPGLLRSSTANGARGPTPLGLLGGIVASSLVAQVALTASPLLLTLIGGSPAAVTSLFAALAILRAPYIIASGAVARLTALLTEWSIAGDEARLSRLRRWTSLATLAGAAVGAAGAYLWGSAVTRLVFGPSIVMPREAFAALAAGSVAAVGNLVLTLAIVARGRSAPAIRAWVVAMGMAGVGAVVLPASDLTVAVSAFVVTEAVAFALLVLPVRPTTAPGVPDPGVDRLRAGR